MKNTELKQELRELKSWLSEIDTIPEVKTPAPDGYFEQMEDLFFAKMRLGSSDPVPSEPITKSIWFGTRMTQAVAAVLAFAVVSVLGYTLINVRSNQDIQLSSNEVEQYLNEFDYIDAPYQYTPAPKSETIAKVVDSLKYINETEIKDYLQNTYWDDALN